MAYFGEDHPEYGSQKRAMMFTSRLPVPVCFVGPYWLAMFLEVCFAFAKDEPVLRWWSSGMLVVLSAPFFIKFIRRDRRAVAEFECPWCHLALVGDSDTTCPHCQQDLMFEVPAHLLGPDAPDRPEPCLACGYDLTGCKAVVCPECGVETARPQLRVSKLVEQGMFAMPGVGYGSPRRRYGPVVILVTVLVVMSMVGVPLLAPIGFAWASWSFDEFAIILIAIIGFGSGIGLFLVLSTRSLTSRRADQS